MRKMPVIPGRGLNMHSAVEARHTYMKNNNIPINSLALHHLKLEEVNNNIESFIGSIEIPIGIVGPLLFIENNNEELVYCAAATLEGALIASMNRGARAVSMSGGYCAKVIHQKMIRTPMFLFSNMNECFLFKSWVESQFENIKKVTEQHSNHAKLLSTNAYIIGKSIHIKFAYSTGDASGQNMTTACTWHAMLWIVDKFEKETGIKTSQYIIEGNGASDKKVSQYAVSEGRGIHVAAECFLKEEAINKVLRTSSDEILKYFNSSIAMTSIDGMRGFNVNVANAIAAIFAATGQDLGSIHESANAILNLEKYDEGLYVSLNLPSLVIGTVGGGTHITKQKEALDIMKCSGNGKVNRLAQLIAGFALGLEVSTYAAIVSGQFAKAHEKLGRNHPINWLKKSELTPEFLMGCFDDSEISKNIKSISVENQELVDNGIITTLTNRVSKKLIGFIPFEFTFISKNESKQKKGLIKSKALDIEVIKGLHFMAATIDPELSDLLSTYKENLEYWNCHIKEIVMYKELKKIDFQYIPQLFGHFVNTEKEIYLLLIEKLNPENILHIDSQKEPEKWTSKQIKNTISAITISHKHFVSKASTDKEIKEFKPGDSIPLYNKLINLMLNEIADDDIKSVLANILESLPQLQNEYDSLQIPKTIIHNDFNPRNIAIKKDETPCIYDWELATINIPHRDIVELLSFVLTEGFKKENLLEYLDFHFDLHKEYKISKQEWYRGYSYSIKDYLLTRISFYEVAGIQAKYAFAERILNNAINMLNIIEREIF